VRNSTLRYLFFVAFLVFSSFPARGQSANPVQVTARFPLTNHDVVQMAKAQFADSTIIKEIHANDTNFDLSVTALVALKNDGVSQAVIEEMLSVSANKNESKTDTVAAAPPQPTALSDSTQSQPRGQITSPQQDQPQSTLQPANSQPASNAPVPTRIYPGSKVYIEKLDGFENYLAAALRQKKVQLVVVADKDQADYMIGGTSEDKKAGWAKIAFLGDIHSDADASIIMTDKKSSVFLFAYSVNKKNTLHGAQTTAEACAKHLQEQIDKEK